MTITLYGYQYSVYSRIVRVALAEKGLDHDYIETNPFSDQLDPNYALLHPFKRVPTLQHNDFILYETSAITPYLDSINGPCLQPSNPQALARMKQAISIIDAYAFKPMMLDLFTQRVVYPAINKSIDEKIVHDAVQKTLAVLSALQNILGDKTFLCGDQLSLADIHLAPVIDYLVETQEGIELLAKYSPVSSWWERIKSRPSIIDTRPDLSGLRAHYREI